jgi:hypothetical protein
VRSTVPPLRLRISQRASVGVKRNGGYIPTFRLSASYAPVRDATEQSAFDTKPPPTAATSTVSTRALPTRHATYLHYNLRRVDVHILEYVVIAQTHEIR